LAELLRVARRKVVLFEPCPTNVRAPRRKSGWTATGTSGSWSRPQLPAAARWFVSCRSEHALNPLNPTFQIEIDVPSGDNPTGE